MFNILLDDLPEKWNGYEMRTDLATGIQLSQCLTDEDLSEEEKLHKAVSLLFEDDFPREYGQISEAIMWLLNGWNNDNVPKQTHKSKEIEVMDFDMDSWRIHAAFRRQYGIDLGKESLHFWEFMGLLSNLDECAFTRVIELRQKKITGSMSKKEKDAIQKAQSIYRIQKKGASAETEEEQDKHREAIEAFNRMRKKA
ncbi:MAG: bacteriophage Gp15 family protein [Butyrivibrio sp.]|nr:bacteriophage Gp15 family protein [Acetatifactor muris]MCM1561173.1 bacteriophage Gp15 family protein [Butyrivibrio sp.]